MNVRRDVAREALERARRDIAEFLPSGRIVRARATKALIDELEREKDTLLAIGSRGVGRTAGFLLGSTAAGVIRKAPCSILIARRRSDGQAFPNKIVVGVDGSPESAAAYYSARLLADRFDAELWPVVAHGGNNIDRRLVDAIVEQHRSELTDEPVTALLAAGANADLIVVGSRGLHGLRALGSVSERVAHQAHSSVLIIREAPWHSTEADLKQAS